MPSHTLSPFLLCDFLFSEGFLMTNLSGLASLSISLCGVASASSSNEQPRLQGQNRQG